MLARWILSNYLRKTAQQHAREAVARAAEGSGPPLDRTPGQLPACEIALVTATPVESSQLVKRLEGKVTTQCVRFLEHAGRWDGRPVVVAETGVGTEAAFRATVDLIELHHPQWIVAVGFAAALDERHARNDVLMPHTIVSEQGDELEVGLRISDEVVQRTPHLAVDRLLTVDRVLRTTAEKRELGRRHQVSACDMEAFAVAEACRRRKVRFLAVRVISDPLDDPLPAELDRMLSQDSLAGKLGVAARAIWERPSVVKDMWKLQENAGCAAERLGTWMDGVIPQLSGL